MAKKHVSFPKRVFTALGLGIVFGIALHLIYGANSKVLETTTDWFSIVGDGYVALLQMIVMPLIFISIVSHSVKYKLVINSLKLVLIFLCFNWYCSYSYSRNFYAIVFGLDASSIDLGSRKLKRKRN